MNQTETIFFSYLFSERSRCNFSTFFICRMLQRHLIVKILSTVGIQNIVPEYYQSKVGKSGSRLESGLQGEVLKSDILGEPSSRHNRNDSISL